MEGLIIALVGSAIVFALSEIERRLLKLQNKITEIYNHSLTKEKLNNE